MRYWKVYWKKGNEYDNDNIPEYVSYYRGDFDKNHVISYLPTGARITGMVDLDACGDEYDELLPGKAHCLNFRREEYEEGRVQHIGVTVDGCMDIFYNIHTGNVSYRPKPRDAEISKNTEVIL